MNRCDSRGDGGAALGARLEEEHSQSFTDACQGPGMGWALGVGHACPFHGSTPVTSQHLAVSAEIINRTQSMPTPHLQ